MTPTLSWSTVSGADYYALAISKYPYGSSNIVYNPQKIYGTSITVPTNTLVSGEKYRWNMQAHNSAGWSSISSILYFVTPTTTSNQVQVSLIMHDGSTYGDVISGMQITGQDGNGVPFSKTTDSAGAISLSGAPGTWQFSAVKDGYDAKSWSNYISISKTLHGYLRKIPATAAPTPSTIQVTLYMHDGSTYGNVVSGMQITGQDGNGVPFSKTTDSSGAISLSGAPGTWQFSASKTGYDAKSWSNYISISKTLDGYLRKIPVKSTTTQNPVQLTICVHETRSDGPVISGVKITGTDGAGTFFEGITDNTGTVVISGSPGDWSFSGSKDGYEPGTWGNNAYTTRRHDAYLQKSTVASTQTSTTTQSTVQLTICVHETRSNGPVISGVKITGTDGAGTFFEGITDNTGTVVISGSPGDWSFSGSKDGYEPGTWGNNAYTTRRHDAYLQKSTVTTTQTTANGNTIEVLLYMHDGSISGSALSDISISGSDGNGAVFSTMTDSSGKISLSGAPGTWQFSAAKTGYDSTTWSNYITDSKPLNGYLIKKTDVAQAQQSTVTENSAAEKPAQCIDVHQYISKDEMARYALDAGFDKENAIKIVAIAWAESEGDIFACASNKNKNGIITTWDRGVLQINTFYRNPRDKNYIITDEQAFNPAEAFKGAYKIVNGKTTGATKGFYEWSAYESTNYYQALSGARDAVESIQSAPTITFSTNPWNTGSLSFGDTAYTSGQIGKYSPKTYEISATVPAGYLFKRWGSTGGISVSSSGSLSTTATLSSDGSLTAEFEQISFEQGSVVSASLDDSLSGSGSSQVSSAGQSALENSGYIPPLKVTPIRQNVGDWAGDRLGRGADNTGVGSGTIGVYGCAMTSAAMVFSAYEVPVNPGELNKWLQELKTNDGFELITGSPSEYDGIVWKRVADYDQETGGIDSITFVESSWDTSDEKIQGYLNKGYPIIAQVIYSKDCVESSKPYDSTHFVVITGYKEDKDGITTYSINDPYENKGANILKVKGPATTLPDPEGRFKQINSKNGAEGYIDHIIVYKGPTTSTLPKENTQSELSSGSQKSTQSSTTVSQSRSSSATLLDQFISVLFPAPKTQQPEVSTIQAATMPEQSTSAPEEKSSTGTSQQSSTTTYYNPPGKPITLSPGTEYEPGQKVYTTTPTFTWKADAKAQYYSLAISKSPYGSDNLVYNNQKITGSSITIPENVLVAGEKYRWNMYAYNNAGRSAVSWTLYFTITQ
ncbi:MAG: C39 family peptidase [Methanoregula sp.]